MKQRLDNKQMESDEAFHLDIVDCKEARLAEYFLSDGFKDLFKYPFCLVFFPREKVSCWDVDVWIFDFSNFEPFLFYRGINAGLVTTFSNGRKQVGILVPSD